MPGEVDAALAHHPNRIAMQRLRMAARAARRRVAEVKALLATEPAERRTLEALGRSARSAGSTVVRLRRPCERDGVNFDGSSKEQSIDTHGDACGEFLAERLGASPTEVGVRG